jgi:GT2 family glycosyltransferase
MGKSRRNRVGSISPRVYQFAAQDFEHASHVLVGSSLKLSVVIPTHRRPELLSQAIASVLRQDNADLEVVVMDDSAGREGEAVVSAARDPRVSYRAMPVPTGGNPSRVRNAAFAHTRGPIVHFLDDDDRVVPGAYARMLRAFEASHRPGVVFGRILPFGDDAVALAHEWEVFTTAARHGRLLAGTRSSWVSGAPPPLSRFLCAAHQLFGNTTMLVNSACMVRRELFERVGGYDEEIQVMEDVDFYTRAIREGGVAFVDAPAIEYRTGLPSIMNAHKGKSLEHVFRRMHAKYAGAHGRLELRAAQIVTKLVLNYL